MLGHHDERAADLPALPQRVREVHAGGDLHAVQVPGEAQLDVLRPVVAGAEPERLVTVPVPGADHLPAARQHQGLLDRLLVLHGLAEREHHRHADPVGLTLALEDRAVRGGAGLERAEAARPPGLAPLRVGGDDLDEVLLAGRERPLAVPLGPRLVVLAGDSSAVAARLDGHQGALPDLHRDALGFGLAGAVLGRDGDLGHRLGGAGTGRGTRVAGRVTRPGGGERAAVGDERQHDEDGQGREHAAPAAGGCPHAVRAAAHTPCRPPLSWLRRRVLIASLVRQGTARGLLAPPP